MKLPDDGFLSPALVEWSRSAQESAPEWFALVNGLNRDAVAILAKLQPHSGSARECMTAAFYARAVQTFEASIILAQGGLQADAGTLARSLVETTIYLGGFAVLEDFPTRIAASNNHHFFNYCKAIADFLETSGLPEDARVAVELRQSLQEATDEGHKRQDINLRSLAKEVGMDPLYEIVYRQLSGDSAHPSFTASERHVVRRNGRVENLTFKPQWDDMERTLSAAITALLGAIEAVGVVFSLPDFKAMVHTYNQAHQALSAKLGNSRSS